MINRLAILLCAAAVFACQPASDSSDLSLEDVAAIRATTERWTAAVRAGRWDDAAATFTADATLWIAGTAYTGRTAIRDFHASMPPWNPTRALHIDEIRGSGNLAYVVGHATIVPEGGSTPVVVSRTLDVRARQADGTWLFVRDMVTPIPLLQSAAPERASAQANEDPEGRLRALGLTLPTSNAPAGNYVSAVRTGNLIYLATHGECGTPLRGKLGAEVGLDSAYASARRVGLCMLRTLKTELGDLRRVVRIVRVTGMVNSAPDFTDQPRVINGCSDLLVAVFGEKGRHARGVLGVASMADGRSVGIEMIVEVRDN